MHISKLTYALTLILASTVAACGTESAEPTITLSTETPTLDEHIEARGSGFTPLSNVTSHLLRSDGTEYPELPIMTDADGEFVHDIDTLLMDEGTHEWWVVDHAAGTTSNVATFDVRKDHR